MKMPKKRINKNVPKSLVNIDKTKHYIFTTDS